MCIEDIGKNVIISKNVKLGKNVSLGHNCIIEENVILGDNVKIECNSIIRSDTNIGNGTIIGANCIIGEHTNRFYVENNEKAHLKIGDNSLIRSGSIIYTNSEIGDFFQTGHQVTIREQSTIGSHVSIGTLSDVQGYCEIGDYVRMHSNVHIGQKSTIDSFVWIFPYVVLTNDPTPPSDDLLGVHIHSFAIIATGTVILPGTEIESDTLVGAGSIVTKNVDKYSVVVGNPAKRVSDIRSIKNKITGENAYPWRYYFERSMPWENMGFDAWYSSLSLNDNTKIELSRCVSNNE